MGSLTPFLGGAITLLLSTILFILRRWYKLYKERSCIQRRQFFNNTEVVLFGVFDGRIQLDGIGGFPTDSVFPQDLCSTIIHWNDVPSPSIIVPQQEILARHLEAVMQINAAPFVLQSHGLDAYFRIAESYGTPSYRYAKFIACLVRLDASLTSWHDSPRIVLVELGALRKIRKGEAKPTSEHSDDLVWARTLEEIAAKFFEGDHRAMRTIEIPFDLPETHAPSPAGGPVAA